MAKSEILTIVGRRRADPMSVSQLSEFRTRRAGTCDPRTLLVPATNLSPYCWDAKSRRTVFVQTPLGIDLTAAPFYYQAQFQHAEKLCLVDDADVIALAAEYRPRFQTPVMIYSVGRSGTTLLSKMLARVPSCVSLSEPDVYINLLQHGQCGEETKQLMAAVTKFYFQPRTHPDATHLVLKFRGMGTELALPLRQALPNVAELFLYRDCEAFVVSSMRAFSYFPSPLWGIRLLHELWFTRPVLTCFLAQHATEMQRFFPWTARYTASELCRLGPVGMLTLAWLSMMDCAWRISQTEKPLPTLRYEELIGDPPHVMRELFRRFGLSPGDTELALLALADDSQRGSVVARQRTSRFELRARDKQVIRQVLAEHPVINRPDYQLPAAIV